MSIFDVIFGAPERWKLEQHALHQFHINWRVVEVLREEASTLSTRRRWRVVEVLGNGASTLGARRRWRVVEVLSNGAARRISALANPIRITSRVPPDLGSSKSYTNFARHGSRTPPTKNLQPPPGVVFLREAIPRNRGFAIAEARGAFFSRKGSDLPSRRVRRVRTARTARTGPPGPHTPPTREGIEEQRLYIKA